MSILVSTTSEIDLAPDSTAAEVLQNVRMILTTMQGSVPLNRSFGLDTTIIDEPIEIAKARLTSVVLEAIMLSEPRANVESIDFAEDHLSGRLVPIVYITEVTS